MNDPTDLTDERHMELETLEAIYPEIQRLEDSADLLTLSIELPVHPASPVTVTFPATPNASGPAIRPENGSTRVDIHELAHLPSVVVQISLPSQYPSEKPPSVSISSMPPWIPYQTTRKLEEEGPRMWKNVGQNLVAFDYIDHVQQSAERVFDLIDGEGTLKVDSQHKIAILDYDIKARQVAFERETFDCGICLGEHIIHFRRTPSLTSSPQNPRRAPFVIACLTVLMSFARGACKTSTIPPSTKETSPP